MATLLTPFFQVETSAGIPASGAKLYFYIAGTSTPLTVYTDSGAGTAHATPVVADASGMFPQIWIAASSYKFILKSSADITLLTVDNIAQNSSFSDSLFVLQDGADTTKQAKFELSSITAGATRTLTVQDVSGTLFVSGGTDVPVADGGTGASTAQAARINLSVPSIAAVSGYLYGLKLSNGSDATNDIDFAAGVAVDSTNAVCITGSAMTKRLDANWAAGTGQGGRNSAAAITDTTYHWYLVAKAEGADPDYYAHTSATVSTVLTALQAETGGASYIYARRIGSILRASSSIRAFTQRGDEFLLSVPVSAWVASNPGTSAVLRTLTVPSGIQVDAIVASWLVASEDGVTANVLLTSPDQADTAPSTSVFSYGLVPTGASGEASSGGIVARVRTNTSGQIRSRLSASGASTDFRGVTHGWFDSRGRL